MMVFGRLTGFVLGFFVLVCSGTFEGGAIDAEFYQVEIFMDISEDVVSVFLDVYVDVVDGGVDVSALFSGPDFVLEFVLIDGSWDDILLDIGVRGVVFLCVDVDILLFAEEDMG